MYVGNNQRGDRKDLYPINGHKYITRHANGTGRDTYIYNDNGGFYPMKPVAEYK